VQCCKREYRLDVALHSFFDVVLRERTVTEQAEWGREERGQIVYVPFSHDQIEGVKNKRREKRGRKQQNSGIKEQGVPDVNRFRVRYQHLILLFSLQSSFLVSDSHDDDNESCSPPPPSPLRFSLLLWRSY
jgi:hypothetical protein